MLHKIELSLHSYQVHAVVVGSRGRRRGRGEPDPRRASIHPLTLKRCRAIQDDNPLYDFTYPILYYNFVSPD